MRKDKINELGYSRKSVFSCAKQKSESQLPITSTFLSFINTTLGRFKEISHNKKIKKGNENLTSKKKENSEITTLFL